MIIYSDSNIVIYAVENNPPLGIRARRRIAQALSLGDKLMVSNLTEMECLVIPYRNSDHQMIRDFRSFFSQAGMLLVPVTAAVFDRAAQIRAQYNFKALDSLHLAAAVVHGADIFLTNDTRLNAFHGITIEKLP